MRAINKCFGVVLSVGFIVAATGWGEPLSTSQLKRKAEFLKHPVFQNNMIPGLAQQAGAVGPQTVAAAEAKKRELQSIANAAPMTGAIAPTTLADSTTKTPSPAPENSQSPVVSASQGTDSTAAPIESRTEPKHWLWLLLLVPVVAVVWFRKRK